MRSGSAALLALLCLGAGSAAAAIEPADFLAARSRLPLESFGDDEGLPQSSAQALALDADGYIWVGTQEGLARYNGRVWQPLALPTPQRSNYVKALRTAAGSVLWVGTDGAGVHRFQQGAWTTYDASAGLASDRVRALVEVRRGDAKAELFAGSLGGLSVLRGERFSPVAIPSGSAPVWCLAALGDELWAGTSEGLFRLAGERWQRFGVKDGLPGEVVTSLLPSATPDGEPLLWVGTETGLARMRSGVLEAVKAVGVGPTRVRSLAETAAPDGRRALWVGTSGLGLFALSAGAWSHFGVESGLPGDVILSLQPTGAASGVPTLWIGTDGTGIVRLLDQGIDAFDRGAGLPPSSLVYSFAETRGRSPAFWLATYGSGLVRFGREGPTLFDVDHGFPARMLFALAVARGQDGEDELWAGTDGFGVGRYSGGRWRFYDAELGGPHSRGLSLLSTTEDDGTPVVWIGTIGHGLSRFSRDRFTRFDSRSGLPSDQVAALLETRDAAGGRVLWIGTQRGLVRLHDGRLTVLSGLGLPDAPVLCLAEVRRPDGGRSLWAGTFGGGAFILDLERLDRPAQLLSTRTTPGLPNDVINSIRQDGTGRVYVLTNKGLTRFTPRPGAAQGTFDYTTRTFTTADGLSRNEGNHNALYLDGRGRLWVGTALPSLLDPRRALDDAVAKPLRIERVTVAGREARLTPGSAFDHERNRVGFEFALLSFVHEGETRYRTQLAGLDAAPSEWLPDHKKEYAGLPAGEYVFRVWGRDYAGNLSGPVEAAFAIRPAPWRTWWAGLGYAGLLAAAVYGGVRLRLRALRRRTDELEAIVKDQTQDLEQALTWTKEAVRRAETLRAATEAVSGTLELQSVLQLILTELRKVVDYDSASVQELEGDSLRIIAGVGFPNLGEIVGITFGLEDPSAPNREVVRTRETLILDDTSRYPLFSTGFNAGAPILSWMGVPLVSGERLVGMLTLDKRVAGSYQAEDARLATAFASQAAISIENARLFEAERRHAAEVESHAAVLEQAANALRESDERTRAVVETAYDAFVSMDAAGAITGWNAQAEAIFGWSRTEAMGRTVADTIIPPSHRASHVHGLTRFLATGEGPVLGRRLELTALHRDGRQFPVELTISAVPSSSGPMFSAFIRDITERRHAEMRLEAQHAATRVLAEATSLAEGTPRILEAICRSLGWVLGAYWHVDTQAECLRCAETWHEGSAAMMEFEALTRRTVFQRGSGLPGRIWESSQPAWIEDVVLDPNFPRAPIAAKAGLHGAFGFPVLSGGAVIGVLEFFSPEIQRPDEDLLAMMAAVGAQLGQYIQRKQAESAVEEERRQLREIVTHAPVAMAIVDRDARYVAHSDLWLQYWQVQEASLVGRRHGVAVPQVAARLAGGLARALRGEVVQTPEDPFELKDGTRAYMSWTLHPWRGAGGGVDGVVIVVQNVDVLVKARQAAEEASRAKSAFVASMSHELRTPLNAILGFVQLMQRRPRDPEDRDQLEIINRSGEHLLSLINQVLSLAKIEAGRVALHPRVFDLALLVRSVADMFGERARAKGLAFDVQDPELPGAVRGDDVRVREILINLLGNAFKFTEQGGVSLLATWKDGRARFDVADTGPGMTPSEIDQLFVVSAQAEAGRQSNAGTGLGLALSREFARLMDGDIVVDSEKGRGTRFRVELSLPAAAADAEHRSRDERRVLGLAAGQKRLRMLVVDDNPEGRAVLSGLLAAVGFEVLEARDGREAVEAWRREAPDMIWMDVSMPVMDGLEATRTIRAEETPGSRVPIVAVTASAFEHEREAVLAAGCDEFVPKPFREGDVFAVLAERLAVRFSYEAAAPAAAGPATAVLRKERFAALAASWRERFRQAIIQGDTDEAARLCDEIEESDGPLAAGIRARLKAYRLDELEELLGG